MKYTLIFICIAFSFISLRAQAQGWEWGRGATGGGTDAWPIATDPMGNVFISGFNFSDEALLDSPVIFGTYALPFDGAIGNKLQTFIAKYDPKGNFLWARGTENGTTFPISITTDRTGNVIVFGSFTSPAVDIGQFTLLSSNAQGQYFIAKYSPDGEVLWAKNAGGSIVWNGPLMTGTSHGNIRLIGDGGIATDNNGNIYLSTYFMDKQVSVGTIQLNNTDTSGFSDDILIAKYDSSGDVVWAKSFGGNENDNVFGLTVTPSGDVYISGMTNSPSLAFGKDIVKCIDTTQNTAFIARFDNNGDPKWAYSDGQSNEYAAGVASDASGNVYMTGAFNNDVISFGKTNIADPSSGVPALFLVKFDTADQPLWGRAIGSRNGGSGAWGFAIAMSPCGAIWVSGAFTDTIYIDSNKINIGNDYSDPVFIAGFDVNGVYVGSAMLQSGADDQNSIACDADGNVYMCADYMLQTAFEIGQDSLLPVPDGQDEYVYLAKYSFIPVNTKDTFFAHQQAAFCPGTNYQLDAPSGYNKYLWDNGNTGSSIMVNTPGTYVVTGSNNCVVIDSITLLADADLCGCEAMIPNAFTPDNDGHNDYFHPMFKANCNISNYVFSIYNRWGQQVFSSTDPAAKWNGEYQGAKAELGTYMYYLKYSVNGTTTTFTKEGDVTLIR